MIIITDIIRMLRVLIIRTRTSSKTVIPLPQTAIVIAPHPDDEVFGCCGLIQRMLSDGKRVDLIVMTGGGKSHFGCCNISEEELIRNRRQLTRNAAAIYGLPEEHIHFLDYKDGGIAYVDDETYLLAKTLMAMSTTKDMAVFYPHSKGEGWSDHISTSEIAKLLCASICPEAKQYEYCVWFWFYNCWKIDWKNACTLKMSKQEYSTKLFAINAYIEPKASCGKPWSGVLPQVFLWATKWKREIFFRVK